MKEIRAVVRPNKLDRINQVLREMPDFPGMIVSRVERSGPGGSAGIRQVLKDFSDKVLIQILCDDELADDIVERIVAEATTGSPGLGMVWVTAVERAVFFNKTVGPGA
ncbi:MAG: P-II family nitrogen regulator [Rhodocyclaceae bacterium]|nr:P-II family nitrogen regulator [Rhodocyclaceae bacterium]